MSSQQTKIKRNLPSSTDNRKERDITDVSPTTFLSVVWPAKEMNKTIVSPGGTVYTGQVNENGQYHGCGILTYPNGTKYVGEFQNGACFGEGCWTYPQGIRYCGRYQGTAVLNGHGISMYPDGRIYAGRWKDGLPDGYGTWVYVDGSVKTGQWVQNVLKNVE